MTFTKKTLYRYTAAATIMILAIAACMSFLLKAGTLPNFLPPSQNEELDAKVVIKTQEAADRIENGIRGIDVSWWQGSIDWKKVAQDDVEFAMIRASLGMEADKNFVYNAKEARKNGLHVGAYHYAKFKNRATMKKEAELFLKMIKQVDITYPVVLDIERTSGLKKSSLTTLCLEFKEILEQKGYKVLIYSYSNFFRDHLNKSKFDGSELWVANYLEQPKIDHIMWQHTSYGTVKGIKGRVDINIAYKDLSVSKKNKISKKTSDVIVQGLIDNYGLDIDMDNYTARSLAVEINKALQQEIAYQFSVPLEIDGVISNEEMEKLMSINFDENTQGNITYLLQTRLFYKGYYANEPTGVFDSETQRAIGALQKDFKLEQTKTFDEWTLVKTLS